MAGLPAHPLAPNSEPTPDHQPDERERNRPSQYHLLRQDSSARPHRDPRTATRRPTTPRSSRQSPRPTPPRRRVRARPQNSYSLRRERRTTPSYQRRGTRPHRFPRTQGSKPSIEPEQPPVHPEDPSVRVNPGETWVHTSNRQEINAKPVCLKTVGWLEDASGLWVGRWRIQPVAATTPAVASSWENRPKVPDSE